jgi:hypothetical protein
LARAVLSLEALALILLPLLLAQSFVLFLFLELLKDIKEALLFVVFRVEPSFSPLQDFKALVLHQEFFPE